MGLFNRFPYTNFHELNLDWIIEKVKEMNAQAVKVSSEANNKSTESLAKSLQALTTSENALNTANGIDEKATRALNNSTSAVNTANTANRSSSQALSQSKSALNIAKEKYGGSFTGDLDNLKRPGTYYCNFSNTTNSPYTSGNFGLVEVLTPSENEKICIQRITLLDNETGGTLTVNMSYRFYLNSGWYPWRKLLVNSAV